MDLSNSVSAKRQCVAYEGSSRIAAPDRLSNLPEDLILHILAFLPTEATIPTGVLSRSWKSLWKGVRHLKFDDRLHKRRFSDHILNALISYQNRVFESLTIAVAYDCDSTELAIWLGIALIKNVAKLVLRLNEVGHAVTFPELSLRRINTLKVLKLMGNINFDLPIDSVSLHCLKELHLYYVSFQNEVSVERLLGGCPILEDLVLELFVSSGIETLVINVPSLLCLTLATIHCMEENIVIKTPCLKYLKTKKLDGVDSFKMEDVSNLIEASIPRHEVNMDENILSKITSVERLSLNAPLKHPVGQVFADLTSLEIETTPDDWCILLSYMLSCSPRLQFLKLVGGLYYRTVATWVEPEHVATCLLTQLHTVEWEQYIWDGADERGVATYILKNAAILRDATFTILEPTEVTNMHERQVMLTQLANLDRASPSCKLVFKDTPLWKSISSSIQDSDVGPFML